jgi:hypothetical protein
VTGKIPSPLAPFGACVKFRKQLILRFGVTEKRIQVLLSEMVRRYAVTLVNSTQTVTSHLAFTDCDFEPRSILQAIKLSRLTSRHSSRVWLINFFMVLKFCSKY